MTQGKTTEAASAATTTSDGKCPIRDLLHRLGDAWSVLVIERLDQSPRPVRFNELRRRVGEISQRMLTVTLRNLERDGLVTRRVIPGSPPAVEYTLSELGRSLAVPTSALVRWSFAHYEAVETARRIYDAQAALGAEERQ
ncbi:MAG TPA: helix-turn-helix domain-containing protein [Roseomonas sp.]|nr:helix-turn-helix domain-containing protein [Roseomonas sp.]